MKSERTGSKQLLCLLQEEDTGRWGCRLRRLILDNRYWTLVVVKTQFRHLWYLHCVCLKHLQHVDSIVWPSQVECQAGMKGRVSGSLCRASSPSTWACDYLFLLVDVSEVQREAQMEGFVITQHRYFQHSDQFCCIS